MIAPKIKLKFGDPQSIHLAREYEKKAVTDSRKNPLTWEFLFFEHWRCPNCGLEKKIVMEQMINFKKFQCPRCGLWSQIL